MEKNVAELTLVNTIELNFHKKDKMSLSLFNSCGIKKALSLFMWD